MQIVGALFRITKGEMLLNDSDNFWQNDPPEKQAYINDLICDEYNILKKIWNARFLYYIRFIFLAQEPIWELPSETHADCEKVGKHKNKLL
ncbi:MAG: hypothetical protein J7539_04515 [Niabella sp.]|nr:hypothetical protein [Niabella sp.]